MLVITYHFGLLRFGWTGVGLFFVLSGYLITQILLETRELPIGTYLGRFYWRRALRILPLYFGVLGAVGVVYLATGFPTGVGRQFPWLATMTYNIYMAFSHKAGLEQVFHHLWSISTEEQFYLLWPMAVWLLGRRGVVVTALAMVVAAPLLRAAEPWAVAELGHAVATPGKLIYYLPFGHVDGFALGAALASMRNAPWERRPLAWGVALNLPIAAIVLTTVMRYLLGDLAEWPIHLGFPMASTEDGFHIWGYTAAYLGFAGWLVWAIWGNERLWIRRLASWGPARWVGTISYGMYVFHWPLLLAMEHWMPLSEHLLLRILQFKLYMVALVLASWASHRLFESRFLALKDRLFAIPAKK